MSDKDRDSGMSEAFLVESARVVTLIGEIDEWAARKVTYSLYHLSAEEDFSKPITLIINCDGGNVFESHGMYDTIKTLRAAGHVIHGRVHGHAMSAAVFVLQACTTRTMTANGMLMAHGLKEFRVGDIRNMEADAEAANKVLDIQVRMLCERGTRGEAYWRELLRDQLPHYYTAEEALKEGLVDAIE